MSSPCWIDLSICVRTVKTSSLRSGFLGEIVPVLESVAISVLRLEAVSRVEMGLKTVRPSRKPGTMRIVGVVGIVGYPRGLIWEGR